MTRRQSGLGVIAAIVILVILGGLSAAIVSLSTGQQIGSARDIQAAQAWQVAVAGSEGGLFRALQNNTCDDTQTWTSADHPAFKVTVVCAVVTPAPKDGEIAPGVARVLRVVHVVATACNGAGAICPDDASVAGMGYVERQRVAVAYCEWDGTACTGP